jgi:opacity protein-like surface antigen
MKRIALLAVFALLLSTGAALAGTVGAGAYGGVNIPIVQDDNGQGSIFGVRVPVKLVSLLTVEPYFGSSQGGKAEATIGGINYTRDGFDATSFGANALLTFGGRFQFYPFAGIGTSTLKRDGSDDLKMTGFNFGLGLGFSPMQKLTVHVRGEGQDLSKDEKGRVFANVTVGASYELFPFGTK